MRPSAFAVAVVLCLQAAVSYAEEDGYSEDAAKIYSRLQKANENIEQIKQQRENLIAELQKFEKQYGEAAGSLYELGTQISGKRQRIRQLNQEIQQGYAELNRQQAQLAKQLKAAFVMGKKEQLRLLLNQQDPALASRMLIYYNYLNKNRLKILAEIKQRISDLESLEQQKSLKTQELNTTLVSHQAVQIGLTATKQERDNLLRKLRQEIKDKSRQLGQLEDNVSESQSLIDKLQKQLLNTSAVDQVENEDNSAPQQHMQVKTAFDTTTGRPFAALKGHLSWPLKGAIIKKFGSPRAATRWDGVVIAANEGTQIGAVSSGRVVFADWLRGYGLLIIIDHGQEYMTLYAFNQSLYKKAGDSVSAGTIIAAVGKSGGRDEAGLYFGIRHKGKPVNPALWCRKG
jgi:murein hydrolase activator